jgi:histone H1/5
LRPVSHPQFVEENYKLEINAAATSQLNRAIAHGAEKGTFVLPKGRYVLLLNVYLHSLNTTPPGPSGKVKLAPKIHPDPAKEVHFTCH